MHDIKTAHVILNVQKKKNGENKTGSLHKEK